MVSAMDVERREIQARRRRGIILKLVREGHENQLSRLDDFEIWAILLKMGQTAGRQQVVTLLQDLQVLEYIDFKSSTDQETGRVELSQIVLTATGLRFYTRRQSNDDVLFN
jgi:hypothetical protein